MSITITAQIFSGRPNPLWALGDDEAAALIQELAANPGVIVPTDKAEGRLGYSGLRVDLRSETLATEAGLPSQFLIHNGSTRFEAKGQEIAARLVEGIFKDRFAWDSMVPGIGPDEALKAILLGEVAGAESSAMLGSALHSNTEAALRAPLAPEAADRGPPLTIDCTVESAVYNPGFWNDAGTVQLHNNCYCYAVNRRIDKFGWPGKGAGRPIRAPFTLENVTAGILADGLRRHGDCLPDTEKPRFLVAMVVAPFKPGDPNYNDFHFYRNSVASLTSPKYFWSHKMGQFPVSNIDTSCNIIGNVERANRGKYSIFGGYFYASKSVRLDGNVIGYLAEEAAA